MLTSDHSMPKAPNRNSRTGRLPAADVRARRTDWACSPGTTNINHSHVRISVAVVDKVHRLECGQDFGPRLHVLHGAATSLQPPYPSIAIEPYDQAITKPVRLRQELDVTWVENIEATVREADPCAHSAPFGEPLVQDGPIEDDLFRRSERSVREQASTEFHHGDGGRTAFSHHHRRGCVGCPHRRLVSRGNCKHQ